MDAVVQHLGETHRWRWLRNSTHLMQQNITLTLFYNLMSTQSNWCFPCWCRRLIRVMKVNGEQGVGVAGVVSWCEEGYNLTSLLVVVQRCPAVPTAAKTAPGTTRFRSASSKTASGKHNSWMQYCNDTVLQEWDRIYVGACLENQLRKPGSAPLHYSDLPIMALFPPSSSNWRPGRN